MARPAVRVRAYLGGLKRRVLRTRPSARRYLRPGVSVDRFLTTLTTSNARYAALRWFEGLPAVQPGEDIDLLVADADLPLVRQLTTPYPPLFGGQKLDVYTETGHRGTDFNGVPYFSKELTARVLDRSVLLHDRYRVPSPVDHLDSLAFHAVYHKGFASGLPERSGAPRPAGPGDHDYVAELEALASSLGRDLDVSLQGIDAYLAAEGLKPSADTLDRFQAGNPWLRNVLTLERGDIGSLAGVIVFVVREAASRHADEIMSVIERYGFEIVKVIGLDVEQRVRAARLVRGGNWGRGAFPVSGGEPITFVIAYDIGFAAKEAEDGQVLNSRSIRAKYAVRDLIGKDLHTTQRFNPLHSTDNGWQSLETLAALDDPGLLDELRSRIAEIDERMRPPWPAERYLSFNGKRSRVAIVQHPIHGRVVAKLFRPGAKRFFERELEARQALADLGLTPALLEHGENWLLSPYYEDDGAHRRRPILGTEEAQLTYGTMRVLARFLVGLRDRGYYLLDFGSHNLVHDRHEGLRILDFEFLQRYPGAVPPIERDYTVVGVAHDGADQPVYGPDDRWDQRVHKTLFHPVVAGLPAEAFLTRYPSNALRLRMAVMQAFWWSVYAVWTRIREVRNSQQGDTAVRAVRRLVRR